MEPIVRIFLGIIEWGLMIYAITISVFYVITTFLSLLETRAHLNKNYFVDYADLLSSPLCPSVSLIAPAYNEGLTIVDNVKSLLALSYNKYEVLVINDGSKDDSIEKLVEAFSLQKVPYVVNSRVHTKPVKGIYKSKNKAFKKLTVVDKENGGKADALNVGLNISKSDLVACIDVDCIIETDAILKMVKPFLEDESVMATGGVVRIANDCVVEDGRLMEVKLPSKLLVRFQVLEYLRAFLLGRMAWSKLNGLIIISGAFGMFKRDIALAAGGYRHDTVGEDMELVVRMRTYLSRQKKRFKVKYIPDPLCWTEAPDSKKVLSRQRNRWARGTIEVLMSHKYMFFNPKYGIAGLMSYPYWLFFEYLAPFVEVLGLGYLTYLIISGQMWWLHFLILLSCVYFLAIAISMSALMAEENTYHKYLDKNDILKLIKTALLEPIIFHPQTVLWSIKGTIHLISGKGGWGEMVRTGFTQQKKSG